MPDRDKTILVVDHDLTVSRHVKELLEFMDAPEVMTASPEDWRERLGERRLEALFVGPELDDCWLDAMLTDLQTFDPGVPVVRMTGRA